MSEVYRIHKTGNYTVISNYHLKDMSISLKAKGLLSLILSLPDDWGYSVRGLASICKDGKSAVASALNELIDNGYIYRFQESRKDGKFGKMVYEIFETPEMANTFYNKREAQLCKSDISDTFVLEKNNSISPYTENQDTEIENNFDPYPQNWDTAKNTEKSVFSPHPNFEHPENHSSELLNTKKLNNNIYISADTSLEENGSQNEQSNTKHSINDKQNNTRIIDSQDSFPKEEDLHSDRTVTLFNIGEEVPMSISPGVYSAVVSYTDDKTLREELFHYAEMCAVNRRFLTGYVTRALLDKLSGLTKDTKEKVEIVRNSTLHRWWDFYPLSNDQDNRSQKKGDKPLGRASDNCMKGEYDIKDIEKNLLSNT